VQLSENPLWGVGSLQFALIIDIGLACIVIRWPVISPERCATYVITIREPGRNVPVQAVNGRCTQCSCRMAWIVIRGKGATRGKIRNASRT